jgi:very-short-patch-repair endonuclease
MRITEEHSKKIEALVSKKTFTLQDIVSLLDNLYTDNQIKYHINKFYPESKFNLVKEYSKGATKLEYLLKQIFPFDKIEKEFPLGERLRVDFVITEPYNLAFEYDGSQHDSYTSFFHQDKAGFRASQERDSRKEYLLNNRGIHLIRIANLDIDLSVLTQLVQDIGYGNGLIADRSLLTLKEKTKESNQLRQQQLKERSQQVAKQKKMLQAEPKKDNKKTLAYQNSIKEKQKAFRKQQYEKQKLWKKENLKK